MAHAEKDDNFPMEGTKDSAGKEHLKDCLKKGHGGRKIVDDCKAGGKQNQKAKSKRATEK